MKWFLQFLFFLLYLFAPTAFGANYIIFNAPGCTGTYPSSINQQGEITGTCAGTDNRYHGFFRATDGTITLFDISTFGTSGEAINTNGDIAGTYGEVVGGQNLYHGFLRTASGAIFTFDAPCPDAVTFATSINSNGDIAGYCQEPLTQLQHGFVRVRNGAITVFDVPGAGITLPAGINDAGYIAGTYNPMQGGSHGFLRTNSGVIISFDAPPIGGGSTGTLVGGINTVGEIAGSAVRAGPPDLTFSRGFLRTSDGSFTVFKLPFRSTMSVFGINGNGDTVGQYGNSGFVRSHTGLFISFMAPGASETSALSINDSGWVTGTMITNYVYQGFLRVPCMPLKPCPNDP